MPDYFVKVNGGEPMMVRAHNAASARNHAVREAVEVRALTTEDAITLAKAGKVLQIAGEEPKADDPPANEQEEQQEQDGGAGKDADPIVELPKK